MNCPFCAKEISVHAVMCPYCGSTKGEESWKALLSDLGEENPNTSPKPKGHFTICFAAVMFIISGALELISCCSEFPLFG